MSYIPGRVLPDASDFAIWTLNEAATPFPSSGTGGVADLSPGAGGVTPYQTGKFVKACQFPGGDVHGYLYTPDLGSAFESSGSITISFWVWLTAFHDQACFVNKNYRSGTTWTSPWTTFGIQQYSTVDGQFAIIMTATGPTILKWASGASYKIALNTWCHLGAVYDRSSNQIRGYLNGTRAITQSESRAIDWGLHGPWIVGGDPSPHCNEGKMEDVRVANVARGDSWFSQVWAAGPPSFSEDRRSEQNVGMTDGTSAVKALSTGLTHHVDPQVSPGVVVDQRLGLNSGASSVPSSGPEAGGVVDSSAFLTLGTTGERVAPLPPLTGIGLTANISPEATTPPTENADGVSDSYSWKTLGTSGLRTPPLPPTQPIGLVANIQPEQYIPAEQVGGCVDLVSTSIIGLAAADYAPDVNDADGKALLGDTGVRHLYYYDATQDPWHTPATAGFYGAGRDGVFYYNGQPCGPGTLGTLAGGINALAWSHGFETYLGAWHYSSRSTWTVLADGKVRLQLTNGVNWETIHLRNDFRWVFTGDFDVQVSYENATPLTGLSDGGLYMEAVLDLDNYFYVRRQAGGGYFDRDCRINGNWGRYQSVYIGNGYPAGRLRLLRVADTVRMFYWNGSAWAEISSQITGFPLGPMRLHLATGGTGGSNVTYRVDFFDFTINSGTTSNKAAWAFETSGAHRGTRSDFPEHALIASTKGSVDIIDADNNKLWMRFVNSLNNAMPKYNGNESPSRAVMRDGVLLIAYNGVGGLNDGGGVMVDFNVDNIQIARAVGSSVTGGILNFKNFVSWIGYPRDIAYGLIQGRNSAKGYSYDNNSWQIPDYPTACVDLLFSGGYEYRAFATRGGIGMHQWHRWYMEVSGTAPDHFCVPAYASASVGSICDWCQFDQSDGELFYLANGVVYSATKSAYDAVLSGSGGTITPSNQVTPPGCNFQGVVLLLSSKRVLVGVDDCIYLSNWPGSFTKFLGPVGSGAAYRLLPGGTVQSLALKSDSGTDYLLVGIKSRKNKFVTIVALTAPPTLYDQYIVAYDGPMAVVA